MVRLYITASSGGSVEYDIVDPYTGYKWSGIVPENRYVELEVTTGASGTATAKGKQGYRFRRWVYYIYYDRMGYGESYQNPYPVTVNYKMSIVAEFEQEVPGKVTVYIRVGTGLGKICVDGICTSSGYYQGVQFTKGATVTVNAEASKDYMLDYVLVDSKKYTSVPFSLSVQADTWITANFAPKPTEIRVQRFTASPNAGYAPLTVTFNASWSGGTPPYTVTVSYGDGYSDTKTTNSTSESFTHTYSKAGTFTATVRVRDSRGQEASSITAVDVRSPPQYLALTITGAEGGTIYYKGDSFRAGQYKIYQLQPGETVEVTQRADSGYRFSYWRVDSKTNTSGVLRFTITTHTNVTAVFEKVTVPSPVVPSPVVPSPIVPSPVVTPSPTPAWEQMMPMIAMVGALLIGGAIVISLLRG
jgi:PKD repeat protein